MSAGSSNAGGAGVAIFGVLFVIGLVITYYWFFIAVGVAVGAFFAVRTLVRRERERRLAAARAAEEIAHRADRQHQWARRGDSRGIYGVEGAALMRSISPEPAAPRAPTSAEPAFAAIARTPTELDALLDQKPTEWRWAAFVSVLVQRLADVQPRIRDCQLRYTAAPRERARNGVEVAGFVTDCMAEQLELVDQLEAFMRAPAFMGVFGSDDDESTADADGIVHVANRLMDYHERFLELAERCRDVTAPSRYSALLRDCSRLMDVPLAGYRTFIADLVVLVDEMPEVLRRAPGDVDFGSVTLVIDVDDGLLERITDQVNAAAKSC